MLPIGLVACGPVIIHSQFPSFERFTEHLLCPAHYGLSGGQHMLFPVQQTEVRILQLLTSGAKGTREGKV
jgi:hypothetical protein